MANVLDTSLIYALESSYNVAPRWPGCSLLFLERRENNSFGMGNDAKKFELKLLGRESILTGLLGVDNQPVFSSWQKSLFLTIPPNVSLVAKLSYFVTVFLLLFATMVIDAFCCLRPW